MQVAVEHGRVEQLRPRSNSNGQFHQWDSMRKHLCRSSCDIRDMHVHPLDRSYDLGKTYAALAPADALQRVSFLKPDTFFSLILYLPKHSKGNRTLLELQLLMEEVPMP